MYCPNPACAAIHPRPTLTLAERHGIEIDYCPHCRGVWLDRGELDKLIERATPAAAVVRTAPEYKPAHQAAHKPWKDDHHRGYGHHPYYGKHKKKSLLSELFDF